jgi:pyrroloquinoline quinone (PQQ) biosynthesis protein C
LARCGPEEVARAANDLGVSPGELVRLASKGPHAADQLAKLLLALGVDPKKLASEDPAMMRDLQRLCITCGHKQRCEHELAAGTAAKHYRNYCPNAISLAALFASK